MNWGIGFGEAGFRDGLDCDAFRLEAKVAERPNFAKGSFRDRFEKTNPFAGRGRNGLRFEKTNPILMGLERDDVI